MSGPENELGGVYVHIPSGAKLNVENKEAPPPITEYEERRKTIDPNATKKLCGGKYAQQDND